MARINDFLSHIDFEAMQREIVLPKSDVSGDTLAS